MIIEIT